MIVIPLCTPVHTSSRLIHIVLSCALVQVMPCAATYLSCGTSSKIKTELHEGSFSASYLVVLLKYYDTYNVFIPEVLGCVATSFDLQHVRKLVTQVAGFRV